MSKLPEQFNIEEGESGNRPGGSLQEWQLWQSKVVKGREVSVKSPEGKIFKIGEDEQFIIERGERGDYEAVIIGPNGERKILRESLATQDARYKEQDKDELEKLRGEIGLESESSQETMEAEQKEELSYNRDILNKITKICSEKGAIFGKDVNLDAEDIKQLGIVADLVEGKVNEAIENDDAWKSFEELQRELDKKGVIMSFKFPPTWLVNGGENATVHEQQGDKSKNESPVQIVVPERVYNAYFYIGTARQLRDSYVKPSAEAIRGTSAKGLATKLDSLKFFIKRTKNKK